MNREEFPLQVGDTVLIDGEPATFIDYPTGGPLFDTENGKLQVPTENVRDVVL